MKPFEILVRVVRSVYPDAKAVYPDQENDESGCITFASDDVSYTITAGRSEVFLTVKLGTDNYVFNSIPRDRFDRARFARTQAQMAELVKRMKKHYPEL